MNKAFTRDDGDDSAPVIPPRAPLPEGVTNYVTPRGLALLKDEMAQLETERARFEAAPDEDARRRSRALVVPRIGELAARIASAVLVDQAPKEQDVVRFGATVRVVARDGTERTHAIVGVDEADGAAGRIAFTSPLARALLGKREGDAAIVHTPRGDEELEVVEVAYRLEP